MHAVKWSVWEQKRASPQVCGMISLREVQEQPAYCDMIGRRAVGGHLHICGCGMISLREVQEQPACYDMIGRRAVGRDLQVFGMISLREVEDRPRGSKMISLRKWKTNLLNDQSESSKDEPAGCKNYQGKVNQYVCGMISLREVKDQPERPICDIISLRAINDQPSGCKSDQPESSERSTSWSVEWSVSEK